MACATREVPTSLKEWSYDHHSHALRSVERGIHSEGKKIRENGLWDQMDWGLYLHFDVSVWLRQVTSGLNNGCFVLFYFIEY